MDDEQVLNMLHGVQTELCIRKQIELQTCPGISSPMLLGFFRPTILLPVNNIPPDELPLILKHELIHYKRRDIWYKALVFLATALHWFNPFVYLVAREIAIQCEISCDEEVVKSTDMNGRQKYVEAIIGVIRKQPMVKSKFSTNFYSGKKGMKHRVFSIMDAKNKRWGFSILAIVIVLTFSTSMMIKIRIPDFPFESSVFASENKLEQKHTIDEENKKVDQTLSKKAKSVLENENDILEDATEEYLLIANDENIFESDNPKLVESK